MLKHAMLVASKMFESHHIDFLIDTALYKQYYIYTFISIIIHIHIYILYNI